MRRFLFLLLLVIPVLVHAQTPVIPSSYEVRFYATDSSSDAIAASAVPSGAYQCNVPPATAFPVGRTTAYWDDPSNAGQQCRYTDPGTGAFVQPPANVRVFVAIAGCAIQDGASRCGPESNRVAYTRYALPGVPTNFGVTSPPAAIALGRVDERGRAGVVDFAAGDTSLGVRVYFGIPGVLPVEKGQQFAVAVWPR